MKSLLEFTMDTLISTQFLIGETFEKIDRLIETNLADLGKLREVYTQISIDSLQQLWKNFEDNNRLLIEAQIKDVEYFTANYFDKVKGKCYSLMPVLCAIVLAELPKEDFPVGPFPNVPQSQRIAVIAHQRLRFIAMKEEIKSINIDSIQDIDRMEDWQKILKRKWDVIQKRHTVIREKYSDMWPDVTYELDYIRHKNMYETTCSLFNYKIDACLQPDVRAIPLIGIPTWRMFDDSCDDHAFAVKSVVWPKFDRLGNVIRHSEITEGERRDLMIRIFLSYQKYPEEATQEMEGFQKDFRPFAAEGSMRCLN